MLAELFEIEIFICIKTDLASMTFNVCCTIKPNQTEPYQVLTLKSWRGSDGKERVLCISKDPALLEPPHQIVSCDIQDTRVEWLTPLQRCSLCIQQHQTDFIERFRELSDKLLKGIWSVYIELRLYMFCAKILLWDDSKIGRCPRCHNKQINKWRYLIVYVCWIFIE